MGSECGTSSSSSSTISSSTRDPRRKRLGLNEISRPKFKRAGAKAKSLSDARLRSRVASLKKKMEQLCERCGAQGFLICSSPSIGVQTWPENRAEVLAQIQKVQEARNKQFEAGSSSSTAGIAAAPRSDLDVSPTEMDMQETQKQRTRLIHALRSDEGESVARIEAFQAAAPERPIHDMRSQRDTSAEKKDEGELNLSLSL